MGSFNHHYIVDTKLIFYGCKQTGRSTLETFNEISKIVGNRPKGKIYLVCDIGASEYRLGFSAYYKGKRRETTAKKTPEEIAAHKQFTSDYHSFLEVCKMLPLTVIDVTNTEADDTASILAFDLAKDPYNRISLITRDQDWGASIIEDHNVKMISPYYREPDLYSKDICQKYHVGTREEFTLRKTLEGDDGDSILHIKMLGAAKTDQIWDSCLMRDEITLEVLREEIHNFINNQKTPSMFKVPTKYLEYGVAETLDEVIDVNYKLAGTMTSVKQLSYAQQTQYHEALKRPHPTEKFDPFSVGIAFFGQPIVLTDESKRLFNAI